MEAIEGMKRGLDCMRRNVGEPAERFFRELPREASLSVNNGRSPRAMRKPIHPYKIRLALLRFAPVLFQLIREESQRLFH
jgi:hypothetical protein